MNTEQIGVTADDSILPPFQPWPKIPRWSRDVVITEKIDGTNASVYVSDDKTIVAAGSRNRWLTLEKDNYGFAAWVAAHADELRKLGPGTHFGEWWGLGIQRGYGLQERRFSLFNTARWVSLRSGQQPRDKQCIAPACCDIVPVLYEGPNCENRIRGILEQLGNIGSVAAPGFKPPEGIVIFHTASRTLFKKTLVDDEKPKRAQE